MANVVIIIGWAIIGWLAVEFLGVWAMSFERTVKMPVGMNILGALAGGLIAGGIVWS